MINDDTVKLLRECDAGIKMGTSSIEEVLDDVRCADLRKILSQCLNEHEDLAKRVELKLEKCCDEGKDPNPITKGMSWIKTNLMLGMNDSDKTVADLMTDGCNMGVKSLNKYLNKYKAADEESKDITKRLINLEEQLCIDMRDYL